jgi:hypothetical protein
LVQRPRHCMEKTELHPCNIGCPLCG